LKLDPLALIAEYRRRNPDLRPRPITYQKWLENTLPSGWDAHARHIELICEHLDRVDRGEIDRLAIFMPPRHGKSETVTVRYPLKFLRENPDKNVLITGYNERFAERFGRKTRNIAVRHNFALDETKQSAKEWAMSQGGILMTRGVGSPPTGIGFDRIIIDDPIRKREDANSVVYREKLWDWFTDDLYTRLEPKAAVILIMTRWHFDDISTRAILSEPSRWTVLKLPALATGGDPLGRAEGEALWPDRWPKEAILRVKEVMAGREGLASFEALYQQNPTPKEGSFFEVGKLQIVESLPIEELPVQRAWDKAASLSGDYTAGVKLAGPDTNGFFYVADVVRGRWNPFERDQVILRTAQLDGAICPVWGPQDPGQAGVVDAQNFIKLLKGFAVRTGPVSGSKELRASPFSAMVSGGKVRIVKAFWNQDFIEELRQFPSGANDDQVDALADSFNKLNASRTGAFTPIYEPSEASNYLKDLI